MFIFSLEEVMFLLKCLLVLALATLIQARATLKDRKILKFTNSNNDQSPNYIRAFMSLMNMMNNFDSNVLSVDEAKRLKKDEEYKSEKKIFRKYFNNKFKGVSSFHRDFHPMRY